jgi:predicted metal-binding membrane protein
VVARRKRLALVAPRFPTLALGLTALAWLLLFALDTSPYGRFVHHDSFAEAGVGAAICASISGGSWLGPLAAYTVGWLLMIMAMMLPTIMPLVRAFDQMVAGRNDGDTLRAMLIIGYLLSWSGFGVVAYLMDLATREGIGNLPWFARKPWLPTAVVLSMAGLFQFSRLKYHCLNKCRRPLGFIMKHWHGPNPKREAAVIGLTHGIFCVGCCWALMSVMFFVGAGNLGWMLVLGLVMAIEKNHVWGGHLAAPVGASLLVFAVAVTLRAVI